MTHFHILPLRYLRTHIAHTFAQGAVVFAVAILLAGLMSLPVREAVQSSSSEAVGQANMSSSSEAVGQANMSSSSEAVGPVTNQSTEGKLFTERLPR